MTSSPRPFQIYKTDRGYIFDTWALRKAFRMIDPEEVVEFEPGQLDALIDNFCDWSDARDGGYETLVSKPRVSVQQLPIEEKEKLFDDLCKELAGVLRSQYSESTEVDDIKGLAEAFNDPDDKIIDFYLSYLRDFAELLRSYDPGKNQDIHNVQDLLNATRELPAVYLATKRSQYEGHGKVRAIRYRILEEFQTDGEIDPEILNDIKEDIVERDGEDILRNWRDYTIVGQLFYDYFKPRIDVYLDEIIERIDDEYSQWDLESHRVNFQGAQNYLNDFAWIALHGGPPASQKERYQLYVGIFGNRGEVGLHVGSELRDEGWEDIKDVEEISRKEDFTSHRILAKLDDVKDEFARLEGLLGGGGPKPSDYFWATTNPSIWSIAEIEEGQEVHYSAFNDEGNKKRVFGAFESASPGDKVLFYESSPTKKIVAEGTVTAGLYDGEDEGSVSIRFDRPIRGVNWDDLTAVQSLEDADPIVNGARGSLFPLTEQEYSEILALEQTSRPQVSREALNQLQNKLKSPQFDISIPSGLYFENSVRLKREIDASLNSGKHIIFTGPPGTGKTKLAKWIAEEATQFNQIDDVNFTTATSEWTAFDTIGGYVPSTSGGGQELIFEPRMFLKCFRQDEVVNNWLIIDEINRSNIDKAFGQLFSVLSADSTELPYERERTVEIRSVTERTTEEELEEIIANPDSFPVTPSWRLLATMNTYDKTSLYEMSYAFMRRFNFIHVGIPELERDGVIQSSLLDPESPDSFASVWLNEDDSIGSVLGNHFREIAVLWRNINQFRAIGPAIVYDLIRFLASYDQFEEEPLKAMTSGVVSLVFPQLEGLNQDKQKQLVLSLYETDVETEDGIVELELDQSYLQEKASDYFGITFDDGE